VTPLKVTFAAKLDKITSFACRNFSQGNEFGGYSWLLAAEDDFANACGHYRSEE
jgi:hypothetical protein